MSHKEILDIIDNYHQQVQRYTDMLKLARQQLSLLQSGAAGTEAVLVERHKLLHEIMELNQCNRGWQAELCRQWNLESFSLKNLKKVLCEERYEELREVLFSLGQLLQSIEEADREAHRLMSGRLSGSRTRQRSTRNQAQQAYQDGMQKRPPG